MSSNVNEHLRWFDKGESFGNAGDQVEAISNLCGSGLGCGGIPTMVATARYDSSPTSSTGPNV